MKRKPQIIQVVQMGQPILRAKAKPVKSVKSAAVREVIANLLATCKDFDGVGIAAPQIGESMRLFIVASHPSPRYPKAPVMKPTPMINPVILKSSEEMEVDWEGCLSIPGLRALVPRHSWVEVRFTDKNGIIRTAMYKNFVARIFQHELDHLDGILFVDHAKPKDMVTEKEYLRLVAVKNKK